MSIFKKDSGAGAFFTSIAFWGIASGCWGAVLNNYLHEIHSVNELSRGLIEFFREMPGLLLIFLLAMLTRFSDWKIVRIGTLASLIGVLFMPLPLPYTAVIAAVVAFSLGEHLVMPVRSSLAMRVATEGNEGRSLGILTGVTNVGTVLGSILAASIFWVLPGLFPEWPRNRFFNAVWILIAVLVFASWLATFTKNAPKDLTRRPKLYFAKKFWIYYLLELFYGARKQIFITFGPFVLIKDYGMPTERMALLLGVCGLANIFAAPWIGRLTDRMGCRFIMVWDTVVLCFVCLMYGFAGSLFSRETALILVTLNFILDNVISTTSLASSIYVKELASGKEEITATLSTGISINHLISILAAPIGGWIWMKFGLGALFSVAAVMSLANTACAMMIPKERKQEKA